jgi:hypothetical protein
MHFTDQLTEFRATRYIYMSTRPRFQSDSTVTHFLHTNILSHIALILLISCETFDSLLFPLSGLPESVT